MPERRVPLAKRALDLVIAIPAIVVLAPAGLLLATLIRLTMGRPVLFRQLRPGFGGCPFELLKFRTMTDRRDASGVLLSDADRLTALGRVMRRMSVDELPELINVMRGEMSLVGPRPLLMAYLSRYSPRQARRHEVLPGITGLAQVTGRNALSWNDRFERDVWYVDHWSFWLDIKILVATVWTVVARHGINQPGRATADEFLGSAAPDPRMAPR